MIRRRRVLWSSGLLAGCAAVWLFLAVRQTLISGRSVSAGASGRSKLPAGDHLARLPAEPVGHIRDPDDTVASPRTSCPQDERVCEAMGITAGMTEMLDAGRDEEALSCARGLAAHTNRYVRLMVLEAYEWIGSAALLDAIMFLDDADQEICAKAERVFWRGIDDLESPVLKARLLEISLETGRMELRLEMLDELLTLPDQLAFQPLARAVDVPRQEISSRAKENLEFMTGELFSSTAQALEWFALNRAGQEMSDD